MLINMTGLYDVIVIGSGPAGATAALELARCGAKVLVIEKEALPRYKCCGGGITNKTVSLLEKLKFDINKLVEDKISNVTIRYHVADHNFPNDSALMITVNRAQFDYALIEQARVSGAEILPETNAIRVDNIDKISQIETTRGTFRSRFVVGADGASGVTARAIDPVHRYERIIGIESEVQVPDSELNRWRSRILLELGRTKAGYAWVFPKADHLSIGIGCLEKHAKNIKDRYYEFLGSLSFSSYETTSLQGGFIPINGGTEVFHCGNILVVGDAAGVADPLTGEGIHNAIMSADIAAGVIRKSLDNNTGLDEYTLLIRERMLPELRIAGTFSKIITLVPSRLFTMLERDERVWRGCRRLLCGEINYSHVMERLKDFGGMYTFVFRRR